MENLENKFVYHGSPKEFDSDHAIPKRNIRSKWNKETKLDEVIFDQESFHATLYKWIALAYTYKSASHEIDGKTTHYNMGVSLYDNINEIQIFGFNSLEESLKVLYGEGGYIYSFDKDKFIHKGGLGNLEMMSEEAILPINIERIYDPVSEMEKLGVNFRFIDLALPKNEEYRNYY